MLTGTLPFKAMDPMGWVHCHIARQGLTPPSERAKQIPEILSSLVIEASRQKPREERYQTGRRPRRPILRRCQTEWLAQRRN